MKIEAIEIDRFGVWSELRLERLSPGLTVFYGPNETGKTTLLEFLRSMFYGFSGARRRYIATADQHSGGSVRLAAGGSCSQLSRHTSAAAEGERLVLVGSDRSRQGKPALEAMLGGIDEPVYNNVFAVGLSELHELATLDGTEAASLLYDLSAVGDRLSLVEVARAVRAARNHVLSAEGHGDEIGRLMAEREKLAAQIDELEGLNGIGGQLAAEREQLDREIAALDESRRQAERQAELGELAHAIGARWHERRELADLIARAGAIAAVPEGAVEQLEAIAVKARQYRAWLGQWQTRWKSLGDEAAALKINSALVRLGPRIEALREQDAWIGTLEKRIAELEGEIADGELQLEAQQRQLGLGDAGGKPLPHLSPRSLHALRRPARALAVARREEQEAAARSQASEQAAQTIDAQVDAALAARGQRDLATAMDRLGALVAQLRRRAQLDERIEQMETYQEELETQSRSLIRSQAAPRSRVAALAALFLAGAILVALFAFSYVGWSVATLGLAMSTTAVGVKFASERSSSRRLGGCQQQLTMLHGQLRQAREERSVLDDQLPPGEGSLASRLAIAERELAALEEVIPLDTRRRAAGEEIEAARSHEAACRQAVAAAERRWKESLVSLGLPPNYLPGQVRTLADRCEELNEIQRRLQLRREEHQQRQREYDGLASRIALLASEVGLAGAARPPAELLRQLLERLAHEQDRLERRRALGVEAKRLRRKRSRFDAASRRLKERRNALLHAAGAAGEEDLRRRAKESAADQERRRRHEQLGGEMAAMLAGRCSEEAVAEELAKADGEPLDTRRQRYREQQAQIAAQLAAKLERRGQLAEQWRTMIGDRRMAARRLEMGVLEKRIEKAIHRWRVRAVASRALEMVRRQYERDRQPETLREASSYLELLTEGRYGRVWTPLDENRLLVDDAQGQPRAIELLSRGTREQLFLALRLALARSFAQRRGELPMVLDDVLVNFDVARARAAAAVLRRFAEEGIQVFVFTCHEHLAEIFRQMPVDVVELPRLRGTVQSPIVESVADDQVAIAPEPEPEPAPEPDVEPEAAVAAPEPVPEVPQAEPLATPPKPRRRRKKRWPRPAEVVEATPVEAAAASDDSLDPLAALVDELPERPSTLEEPLDTSFFEPVALQQPSASAPAPTGAWDEEYQADFDDEALRPADAALAQDDAEAA